MSIHTIEQEFMGKVSAKVRLIADGIGRYRVFTPFQFNDGDHLAIVLKQVGQRWLLSDEAHTYMHLSYKIDTSSLKSGTRKTIVDRALSMFQVEDHGGELVLNIANEQYGDALFSFIQALLKISDVTYLSPERVRSTFLEDFQALFTEKVPAERRTFNWHEPALDHKNLYKVDCRINGMAQPLFVHALSHAGNTQTATIALHQFKVWGLPFRPLAIFEEHEKIGRPVRARFADVVSDLGGEEFSNFANSRDRIARYIEEVLANGAT